MNVEVAQTNADSSTDSKIEEALGAILERTFHEALELIRRAALEAAAAQAANSPATFRPKSLYTPPAPTPPPPAPSVPMSHSEAAAVLRAAALNPRESGRSIAECAALERAAQILAPVETEPRDTGAILLAMLEPWQARAVAEGHSVLASEAVTIVKGFFVGSGQ